MQINLSEAFPHLAETSIVFNYPKPSESEIIKLKKASAVVVMPEAPGIYLENAYYAAGYLGTRSKILTRQIVLERLQSVAAQLTPFGYGLQIFDAFRSLETQQYLFNFFSRQIQQTYPSWNAQEVDAEARRYVAHPTDHKKGPMPTHNTGGAVDLTIYELASHQAYFMGTKIDDAIHASATEYFESPYDQKQGFSEAEWLTARQNRRILFHLMKAAGFANYFEEWWHFDLGDSTWAKIHDIAPVFDSMESEVSKFFASTQE